ncbi:hypothetical protein [Gordonia rhizosphera]|uniref:Uncharacterized protein n=1 Tax=Gordonia rhizosphera NBRC 16068 TaxID=1108045 RepID=K6WVA2_9ACTN|nr:hypothetical protein [Gordonia rhizosphera]GAB90489.1 hypothetical protein GORHZ_104_00180 [Gordonia rhizosphera NBRC 16068]
MLIATGIGLGAFNAWWFALVVGVPVIILGMSAVPRATRTSELPVFRRGGSAQAIPIDVEALTRSSLSAGDLQPTMLTATIHPPDDTAYRARWITSMSRGHAQSLLPSVAESIGIGDGPMTPTDLASRTRDVLTHIVGIGPTASDNILTISLDDDGTSRAEVYDPTSGQALSLWKYGGRGWQDPRRTPTVKRRPDTFRADEIAGTDVTAMATTMQSRLGPAGEDLDLTDFAINRPVRGHPVALVGGFGDSGIPDIHIAGRPDGTVADFFDPGDFDTSFRLARAALAEANLAADRDNLRRFEIRGTAPNTPTMYAGRIQSSGGVLIEYTEPGRSGTVTVVPGEFPEVAEYPGTSQGSFSFDDVSPEVFEAVREEAMARGGVDAFDREAVDIQMTSIFQTDGRPVIQVELAGESASAGAYSVDGEFVEAGH